MPRPGPPRPIIGVRISEAGIAALDKLADETGTKRSDVVRALLDESLRSVPVMRAARKRLTN